MKKIFILFTTILFSVCALAQNIDLAEYWMDVDPGFGAGTAISIQASEDISLARFTVPAGTTTGLHIFGVRSRDENNVWSHTNLFPVYVFDSTASVITDWEYFWDVDSGFTQNADTLLSTPTANFILDSLLARTVANLNVGTHTLFVRSKDARGRWSHTNYLTSIFVDTILLFVNEPEFAEAVTIFPNPVTNKFSICPDNERAFRVMIYSSQGVLLIDRWLVGKTEMDISKYPAGEYLIVLSENDGKIYRSKILKL